MHDVCIIGGGISGMTIASYLSAKGLSVTIIEKNKKLGSKIYATGNGKCNITNKMINVEYDYNSSSKNYRVFLEHTLSDNAYRTVIDYFKELGIVSYIDSQGYAYPCSNQASSVVWALCDSLNNEYVDILTNSLAESIETKNDKYIVTVSNKSGEKCQITAKYILLACGGKSYSKLGGSEYGYKLANMLQHTIEPLHPALCPLTTDNPICEAAGVRVKTKLKLYSDNSFIAVQEGELQITDYGISGIAVFNLSSKAVRLLAAKHEVNICFDLLYNAQDQLSNIDAFYEHSKSRSIMGALNGIVNEKIALLALKHFNLPDKCKMSNISKKQFSDIILYLQNYKVMITGTKDYDMAQVTAGGVRLEEINPATYESLIHKNLYITGEMLDVDGCCGGYNITFAVLSGLKAGEDIYAKNKPN